MLKSSVLFKLPPVRFKSSIIELYFGFGIVTTGFSVRSELYKIGGRYLCDFVFHFN